jgi:DNA-binding Lrp family transcriptional regulator
MPSDMDKPLLDDKDQRIAEEVIRNPSASVPILARLTGLPESTLSKRLSFLLSSRYLERTIRVVRWRDLGYPFRHRVDIKVDQRMLSEGKGGPRSASGKRSKTKINSQEDLALYIKHTLTRQYEGRLVVLDVGILLGHDADISMVVCSRTPDEIRRFVTSDLRSLGGVLGTSTSEEIWTCPESIMDLEPAAQQVAIQDSVLHEIAVKAETPAPPRMVPMHKKKMT